MTESVIKTGYLSSVMSKCPEKEHSAGEHGSFPKMILAVSVIVAMLAVSCLFVFNSDPSEADHTDTDYERYYYDQIHPLGKVVYDKWIAHVRIRRGPVDAQHHEIQRLRRHKS